MSAASNIVRWTPWAGPDSKPAAAPRERVPLYVRLRSGRIIGPIPPDQLGWQQVGSPEDITHFAYPDAAGWEARP